MEHADQMEISRTNGRPLEVFHFFHSNWLQGKLLFSLHQISRSTTHAYTGLAWQKMAGIHPEDKSTNEIANLELKTRPFARMANTFPSDTEESAPDVWINQKNLTKCWNVPPVNNTTLRDY